MVAPSIYGELADVPVGTPLSSREEVRSRGLHRHEQAGISGHYDDGADAIVVSGGYVDDQDHGSWILYTGQGGRDVRGRQVRDQELTRGNRALVLSEERGLPVRVIRGAGGDPKHSPMTGYRYDGLYGVQRHWVEASVDGPLIFRYELQKLEVDAPWPTVTASGPPTASTTPPKRAPAVVQRIVRNTAITQYVKDLHNYTCQFCGIRLEVGAGAYAEGAHIRGLGGRHAGLDVTENVLCLCPNDHVLFDKGALYLDEKLRVVESGSGVVRAQSTQRHRIDPANVAYHREHLAGIRVLP